jgi:hypothetical protein
MPKSAMVAVTAPFSSTVAVAAAVLCSDAGAVAPSVAASVLGSAAASVVLVTVLAMLVLAAAGGDAAVAALATGEVITATSALGLVETWGAPLHALRSAAALNTSNALERIIVLPLPVRCHETPRSPPALP